MDFTKTCRDNLNAEILENLREYNLVNAEKQPLRLVMPDSILLVTQITHVLLTYYCTTVLYCTCNFILSLIMQVGCLLILVADHWKNSG